jgi:hypothetical protein
MIERVITDNRPDKPRMRGLTTTSKIQLLTFENISRVMPWCLVNRTCSRDFTDGGIALDAGDRFRAEASKADGSS